MQPQTLSRADVAVRTATGLAEVSQTEMVQDDMDAALGQDAGNSDEGHTLMMEHPELPIPAAHSRTDGRVWARIDYEAPFFVIYAKNSRFSWWPFAPWQVVTDPRRTRIQTTETVNAARDGPGIYHAVTTTKTRTRFRFATYGEAADMVRRLGMRNVHGSK